MDQSVKNRNQLETLEKCQRALYGGSRGERERDGAILRGEERESHFAGKTENRLLDIKVKH